MISDKLGQELHDRSTRGKQITNEEQAQLESWYEYHDNLESEIFGVSAIMNQELIRAELPVIPSKQEAMLAAETGRGLVDTLSEVQNHGSESIGLGTRITQRFVAIGGIDLDITPRSMARPTPIFADGVS